MSGSAPETHSDFHRLLVAVDESEASRRAVSYVARFIGSRTDYVVFLVNVLPPVPVRLIEHGGGELAEGKAAEERMAAARRKWVEEKKQKADPVLAAMRDELQRQGLEPDRVRTLVHPSEMIESVAQGLLQTAEENEIHTIVVGRNSLSWIREVMHRHVGEDLVRKSHEGLTVWVVH